jgi:hypothetical protein
MPRSRDLVSRLSAVINHLRHSRLPGEDSRACVPLLRELREFGADDLGGEFGHESALEFGAGTGNA